MDSNYFIKLNNLIATEEVIKIAESKGVRFGFGQKENRIRYFIKKGLLPHQQRKYINGKIVPHLPEIAIDRLVEIQELQDRFRYTVPQIIEHFNDKKVLDERVKYEGRDLDIMTPDVKSQGQEIEANLTQAAVSSTQQGQLGRSEQLRQSVQAGQQVQRSKVSQLDQSVETAKSTNLESGSDRVEAHETAQAQEQQQIKTQVELKETASNTDGENDFTNNHSNRYEIEDVRINDVVIGGVNPNLKNYLLHKSDLAEATEELRTASGGSFPIKAGDEDLFDFTDQDVFITSDVNSEKFQAKSRIFIVLVVFFFLIILGLRFGYASLLPFVGDKFNFNFPSDRFANFNKGQKNVPISSDIVSKNIANKLTN